METFTSRKFLRHCASSLSANVYKHGISNSNQWGGWYSIESMLERTMGLFSRVPHLSMCRTARVYTACPHPPTPLFLLTWARWVSVSFDMCESLLCYCWHGHARWVTVSFDMCKSLSCYCCLGQGESLFLLTWVRRVSVMLLFTWARWVSISCWHGQGESLFLVDLGKVSLYFLLT